MKKILLFVILCLTLAGYSQTTTFEWAKSIGGQNYDNPNSIFVDNQGNVYVTGKFQKYVGTEVDFDPGPGVYNIAAIGQYDAFVLKLNTNGEFLWAKTFGGSAAGVSGNGITVDTAGNVYTTGTFTYSIDFDPSPTSEYILTALNQFGNAATDVFISKLDANGNFVWAKRIGSQFFDTGNAITTDTNNNVYVTGKFAGTVNFNTSGGTSELTGVSSSSGFVLKLDSNGNFGWAKSISGAGTEVVYAITVDNSGNVYATGNFTSATDLNPGATVYKITGSGVYILKLDNNGDFVFAKAFVGNSNLDCNAIKVDASGNIFTTGSFQQTADFDPSDTTYNLTGIVGGSDVFLSKLDNQGNFVWAKWIYSTSKDVSKTMALDNIGNVYIAPNFVTNSFKIDNSASIVASTQYSENTSILKFDTSGVLLAKNFITGASSLETFGMSVDENNNVYTCGMYTIYGDFNPDTPVFNLTSNGYTDVFISKIKLKNETLNVNQNNPINQVHLFPNPTSDHINLSVEKNLDNATIKIISIIGQTVAQESNISGNSKSINVSGLSKGVYILQVLDGKTVTNSKFIKQ